MERIVLVVPGKPGCLCLVRGAVKTVAKRLGFKEKEACHIVQAVDEACSNVIKYAYKGLDKTKNKIILNVTTYKNKIRICIRDFGPKINPKKIQGRKLNKIRPGGLGVHLIHSCMDDVRYDARLKKGMRLVMEKQLRKKQ